ncbi:perforin-1-like [Microcaecilia unicolor]|uniref:Perforin-1-like n=1 Tax=Microcaecilia unicolor TaxID=1415580 RepID=A0A6P7YNQ8_9AMPH|nr:perforin-1-like [Microcaecilia unicolor]
MLILLQWTFFFFASQLFFPVVHGQCREATLEECWRTNTIPGYNLAGEGFDVTTLKRKGAYIISMDDVENSANSTCILCRNPLLGGQRQWLPQAIGGWQVFPKCSINLASVLYESSTDLAEAFSSSIQNDWTVGLGVKKKVSINVVVAGSQSQLSQFAMKKSTQDRFSFVTQEIVCKQYRYHIRDHPTLKPQFVERLRSLPTIYNNQTRTRYDSLINIYGTHYIQQVELGGRVRAVTALRTCEISLDQLSDHEVKECLGMEASINLFGLSSTSASQRCNTIKQNVLSKRNFSARFSDRRIEVVGGDISLHTDLFFSSSKTQESFRFWASNLSSLPDVISYSLVPLHELIPDTEPTRKHLQRAITDYILKRAVAQQCLRCPTGGWFSQHTRCKCKCQPTSQSTSSCCSRRRGLSSFSVTIHRSEGLKGDPWPNPSDGYVKVFIGAKMRRTRTIMNQNNPRWNEKLDFGELLLTPQLQLRVEVWDKDIKWDDLLGSCWRSIFATARDREERCYFRHGNIYFSFKATCSHQLSGPYCRDYTPPRN